MPVVTIETTQETPAVMRQIATPTAAAAGASAGGDGKPARRKSLRFSWGQIPEVGERFAARVVEYVGDASALVQLRKNVFALLHHSEYSWIDEAIDLKTRLKIGAKVEVVVTNVRRSKTGMAYLRVSHRRTRPNPWETIETELPAGTKTWAQVDAIDRGGVDVILETGYRALVPTEELSWPMGKRGTAEQLQPGQWIEVVVQTIDKEKRRITVSYREALPNPWATIEALHAVGQRTSGTIERVFRQGSLISLESGLVAYVPHRELHWTGSQPAAKDGLRVGERMEVVIQSIDKGTRRIQASHRLALPNPWEQFLSLYPIGCEATGVVEDVLKFGAFVRLEHGYTGLLHKSRMDGSDGALSPGQPVRVRILDFDPETMRIMLGAAANDVAGGRNATDDLAPPALMQRAA